jgi:hypothetical protein
MPKATGWGMYEVVAISLPNLYKCDRCGRLVHCMHAHWTHVCYECRGAEPHYEKVQAMTLKDQRENILKILTHALDQCIRAAEEQRLADPANFDAQIEVRFRGTSICVKTHPALDFTQPIEPQFETKAKVVDPAPV